MPDGEWSDADRARWHAWEGSRLIWGAYGVGKTGLAVGYLHERFMDQVEAEGWVPDIKFVSMPDFLSELRDTYKQDGGSEMDVIRKYRDPWMLVLDDLGAEHVKDTGWLEDRLYQLIGHRHADIQDTVFTSNLSPAELGARIGERNMWRIVEMCGENHIVHVEGENLRVPRK